MTVVPAAAARAGIDDIATLPGVVFCAVVELATGLVVFSAGSEGHEALAESAASYWALGDRMAHVFRDIGPQRALSVQLSHGVFSVMPCGREMLLATLSRANALDWKAWLSKVDVLKRQLEAQT